jgi:DNA-binding NtrC family response regulator
VSTILFVDDHHAFRTVFAETLRSAGHVVLEAGTKSDVDHLVEHRSGNIDLLIVEAVLSTANGVAIAERLQALYAEMQVLFISGESPEDLSGEGLLPEGAHFLRKPFDAEDLIAEVAKSAKSRRAARKSIRLKTARSHR